MCASQNVPSDLGSKAAGKRLKAFWVQGRDGGKEVKEGMRQRKKKKKSGRGRDRCCEDSPGLANQSEHTWIRRFKSFLFFMNFRAFYISGYIMFQCTWPLIFLLHVYELFYWDKDTFWRWYVGFDVIVRPQIYISDSGSRNCEMQPDLNCLHKDSFSTGFDFETSFEKPHKRAFVEEELMPLKVNGSKMSCGTWYY